MEGLFLYIHDLFGLVIWFNGISTLQDYLMPNSDNIVYTYVQYIYIHIYIYMCVCVCVWSVSEYFVGNYFLPVWALFAQS